MDEDKSLLSGLQRVHQDVLDAADVFERMLRGAHPGDVLLTNARLKLTVTTGRKRVMLEKIYAALGELRPADAEKVRELRADTAATLARASKHISHWTTREMARDWAGYVASSTSVPKSMRASVSMERRFLYPLLDRQERSAA